LQVHVLTLTSKCRLLNREKEPVGCSNREQVIEIEQNQTPPVDMDFIQVVTNGDTTFTHELFTTFVAEVDSRIPRLEKAMNPFKGRELRELAHSFVGTGACLGAYQLQERARKLEELALAVSVDELQEAFAQFQEELLRTREFVKAQLDHIDREG
jgi:HPt (histidine-containing phosphotransfer) domain-containing protein